MKKQLKKNRFASQPFTLKSTLYFKSQLINVKQLKLFTLLGMLLFTFINCEYDEKQNVIENNINTEKQPTIKKLNFEQLSQNKKLINKLNKISNRKNTIENVNGKIVFSSESNFFINTDDVFYIEQDSLNHSYTFRVYRDSSDVLLENLILNSNDSIGYDLYLAKYDITQTELEQLENGQNPDLSQKTSVTSFDDTNIVENIFSKAAIETLCLETYTVYGYCASGQHNGDNMDECNIAHTMSQTTVSVWVTCIETIEVGGGGSSTSTSVATSPIHGGGGGAPTPPVNCNNDPCCTLKTLLNIPAPKNLKNIVDNQLQPNIQINQNGEKGAYFRHSGGQLNTTMLPATTTNQIGIPTGCDNGFSSVFSAIHTHPKSAYPMFSFSDVYTMAELQRCLQGDNQNFMAPFLLTCKDDNNVPQTYAIMFDNVSDDLNIVFNNPKYILWNIKSIITDLNELLQKEYAAEEKNNTPANRDYEKVFINFLSKLGVNVSLYKANSNLTNFSKLTTLNYGVITPVNCN